jgi:hypothetical protein
MHDIENAKDITCSVGFTSRIMMLSRCFYFQTFRCFILFTILILLQGENVLNVDRELDKNSRLKVVKIIFFRNLQKYLEYLIDQKFNLKAKLFYSSQVVFVLSRAFNLVKCLSIFCRAWAAFCRKHLRNSICSIFKKIVIYLCDSFLCAAIITDDSMNI